MAAPREAGTKTAGEQRMRGNKCRQNGQNALKKGTVVQEEKGRMQLFTES